MAKPAAATLRELPAPSEDGTSEAEAAPVSEPELGPVEVRVVVADALVRRVLLPEVVGYGAVELTMTAVVAGTKFRRVSRFRQIES